MSGSPALGVALSRPYHHHRGDPGGINPAGVELPAGEDPLGIPPPMHSPMSEANYHERNQNWGGGPGGPGPPPTPTRRDNPMVAPVMAMLVGIPPPPPTTPPPPKRRHRDSAPRSRSSPRTRPTAAAMKASIQEFEDNLPKSKSVDDHVLQVRTGSPDRQLRHIISPTSRGSKNNIISPTSAAGSKNSIVQERLRSARAIYESNHLALMDPPSGDFHVGRRSEAATPSSSATRSTDQQENRSPSPRMMPGRGSGASSISKTGGYDQPKSFSREPSEHSPPLTPSPKHHQMQQPSQQQQLYQQPVQQAEAPVPRMSYSRMSAPPTPQSAVTIPIGNHAHSHLAIPPPPPPSASNMIHAAPVTIAPQVEYWSNSKLQAQIRPNNSSVDASSPRHQLQQQEQGATGRGGNLGLLRFRSKTPERKKNTMAPERRRSKTPEHGRHRSTDSSSITSLHTSSNSQGSSQEPKKGFFQKIFRGKKKNKESILHSDDHTVVSEAPTASLKTLEDRTLKTMEDKTLTHYLGSGSESDEPYTIKGTFEVPDIDEDRPEMFMSHDEVSTLTAPTAAESRQPQRQDPVERSDQSADPMGHYWEHIVGIPPMADHPEDESAGNDDAPAGPDPFTEHFLQQASQSNVPLLAKEVLHITVPPAHDPVGASPLNSQKAAATKAVHPLQDPSPRGYQTPSFAEHPAQDPIGESPLHKRERGPTPFRDGSPYAPDPPLYKTDESALEESDSEEKKDDGMMSSPSTAAVPSPHGRTNDAGRFPPSPRRPFAGVSVSSPLAEPLKETILSGIVSPRFRGPPRIPSSPTSSVNLSITLTEVDGHADEDRVTPKLAVSPKNAKQNVLLAPKSGRASTVRSTPESPSVSSASSPGGEEKIERKTSTQVDNYQAAPKDIVSPIAARLSFRTSPKTWRLSSTNAETVNKEAQSNIVQPAANMGAFDKRRPSPERPFQATAKKVDNDLQLGNEALADVVAPVPSGTTVERKKPQSMLTVSAAARVSAKTIAYLHSINGEPSPRRAWRKPDVSDEESPVHSSSQLNRSTLFSSNSIRQQKHRLPQPPISKADSKGDDPSDIMRLFAAYSGKFRGRRPKSSSQTSYTAASATQGASIYDHLSPKTASNACKDKFKVALTKSDIPIARKLAFKKGMAILRQTREGEIVTGKATRVVLVKRVNIPKVQSHYGPVVEPKDPIQRAGRRLLSKAAVPIQTAWRRHRAQREAVDRMWGLIEIQSILRRWKAEASLIACCRASISIQKVFRGFRVRKALHHANKAVIEIQRIIRGYLAAARTYDEVFQIILAQAQVRGMIARRKVRKMKESIRENYVVTLVQARIRSYFARKRVNEIRQRQYDLYCITLVQAKTRGNIARDEVKKTRAELHYLFMVVLMQARVRGKKIRKELHYHFMVVLMQARVRGNQARLFARRELFALRSTASSFIQTWWRSRSARIRYQFTVVDIIIAQNVVRRWIACRHANELRALCLNRAATKIQSSWRAFHAYTDYIFSLVDILSIQRLARRWHAKRKLQALRGNAEVVKRTTAAVKIQSEWRRYSAQVAMLVNLVHVIVVQSVVRRYLSRYVLIDQKAKRSESMRAATKIQATWRGFWRFSQFIIMQFEVIKCQAKVRGLLARRSLSLHIGSCIMIQCAARNVIARKRLEERKLRQAAVSSAIHALRESSSCKKIQFWWRVVLDCRREKAAALVIERFFMMVKLEVDKEIQRVEEKKITKKEHKKREKRSSEEKARERVWLSSMDDGHVDVFASFSPSASSAASRGKSPRLRQQTKAASESRAVSHRASSPPMNLVMRHELEAMANSGRSRRYSGSGKGRNDYDGVLSPTNDIPVADRAVTPTRNPRRSSSSRRVEIDALDRQQQFEHDVIEAVLIGEVEKKVDRYLSMYGVKSAPHRASRKHHFFADDLESLASSSVMEKSRGVADVLSPRSLSKSPGRRSTSASLRSPPADPPAHHRGSSRRLPTRRSETPKSDVMYYGRPHSQSQQFRDATSPRQGKVLVMNPYPAYSYHDNSGVVQGDHFQVDPEYIGEEFGMI